MIRGMLFDFIATLVERRDAETLYIGDSYVVDYLGAKGAGMPVLLIDPRRESVVPAHERLSHVFDTEQWLATAV